MSNYVLDRDHLQDVVDYFLEQDAFAFDIESTGEHRGEPLRNEVVWLSLATKGMAVAIPFGHPNGNRLISRATRKKNKVTGKFDAISAVFSDPPKQLRPSEVFSAVAPLFTSDQVKVGHGVIFDLVSVAKYLGGHPPAGPYADTIVLQHLLDENLMKKGLKDLVKKYYALEYDAENVGRCIEAHSFNKVARYAYLDAKYTWHLYENLLPKVEDEGLDGVFWDIEMPLLSTLIDMRMEGAPVDVDRLAHLEVDLAERLVGIEAGIYKSAGQRFNLNAPGQKAKVLFAPKSEGGQGLKPRKLTDGGRKKDARGMDLVYSDYSTDAESLEYFTSNPVAKGILDYQEITRLLNTYVRGYLGVEGDPKRPCRLINGRIHADFVQYGTVTGRFSCREPNLQNIPRPDTDLGKQIRGLFIAPPGHKLIVADYGQIEMVLLAHYLSTGRLFDGFREGIDPHTATAAAVFGVKPEDVTKEMRQAAKGINFAVVYGAGPAKVAAMSGTSERQAKEFLATHERAFPEIYSFKESVIRECRRRKPPHIKTLLGRKRRLPTINSAERGLRGYAERQAVNSLIQGSAADLIKLAMIREDERLLPGMRLILSVHDELVTVVEEDQADKGVEIVREAMLGSGIQRLVKVRLSSDIKVVDRWAEAK